jgi:urate oxidase
MAKIAHSAYGKSRVRLVKVERHGERHDLTDLTIAIGFEGDFNASYVDGDNTDVLPTDTMRNTVYALAAQGALGEPEEFGQRLGRHFLERSRRAERVAIDLVHHLWSRIVTGNTAHPHAFLRDACAARTAHVRVTRDTSTIEGGLEGLVLLKSARSAFAGFLRDEYTTLAETTDRLLATSLSARWQYARTDVPFGVSWAGVRQTLVEAFAAHDSRSVQHTLYAMADAVLASHDEVVRIHLAMPNKHHLPVDLAPFGLKNPNEVFVATDEPHGLIEATVAR